MFVYEQDIRSKVSPIAIYQFKKKRLKIEIQKHYLESRQTRFFIGENLVISLRLVGLVFLDRDVLVPTIERPFHAPLSVNAKTLVECVSLDGPI